MSGKWLFLLLPSLVACKQRTEIVIGVATDLRAPDTLDAARLTVANADNTVVQLDEAWPISGSPTADFNLPGSYGVFSDGDELPLELELKGFNNGVEIISRRALLSLIEGETLFFRMTLVAGCIDRADCTGNQTCVEGTCVDRAVDSSRLPSFEASLVTELTCASGPMYINTADGEPMQLSDDALMCPTDLCSEGTCRKPEPPRGACTGSGVCTTDGGASCFVAPLAAARIAGGNPPNFACTAALAGTLANTTQVGGGVTDFQTENSIAGGVIELRTAAGALVTSTTSSGSGAWTVSLAGGASTQLRAKVSASGQLDTWTLDLALASALASQSRDLVSFSSSTAAALPALVGVTRTPGTALLFGTVVDCDGAPVENVIATLTTTAAQPGTCSSFVDAVQVYYVSDTVGLPVRRTQLQATSQNGEFILVEIPPTGGLAPTQFLQVWGYPTADDLALGEAGLVLLAEYAVFSLPDSVLVVAAPTNTGPIP